MPRETYGFAERHPLLGTIVTVGVLVVAGLASGELVGMLVIAAVRLAIGSLSL